MHYLSLLLIFGQIDTGEAQREPLRKGRQTNICFCSESSPDQRATGSEPRLGPVKDTAVWEHQQNLALATRHQMNRRSRTRGSESSGSLLSSLGRLALP